MISMNWGTRVVFVPKADLTLVQSSPTEIYNMDLNWFRLQLKDLEDGEEGMPFPDTHRHNTEVSLGGLTFARVIEMINDYTITFEDGQYAVNLIGANSNVADKVNVNQVSVRSSNSAGMIVVSSGSGLSLEEHNKLLGLPDEAGLTVEEHNTLMILPETISGSGSGGLTQEEHDRLFSIPITTTSGSGLTQEEHDRLWSLPLESGLTPEEHNKLLSLPDTISGTGMTQEEHDRLFILPTTISGGLTDEDHIRLWSIPTDTLTVEEHDKLLGLPNGSDIDTIVSEVISEEVGPTLLRMLGLLQENQYLDNTTYTIFNGQKLLSSGRIRTYSDAISVGTTNNVIATYNITTTWNGDEMQSYKVVRV